MKKSFTSNEVIGLISATLFGVLFFVPILGNLPLIESDFIFYGTMLPVIVFIIFLFLSSKDKIDLIKFGVFVLIVFLILMLFGLDIRDVYFLSLSLICLLIIIGIFIGDSEDDKKEVKKVTISSSKSKLKH